MCCTKFWLKRHCITNKKISASQDSPFWQKNYASCWQHTTTPLKQVGNCRIYVAPIQPSDSHRCHEVGFLTCMYISNLGILPTIEYSLSVRGWYSLDLSLNFTIESSKPVEIKFWNRLLAYSTIRWIMRDFLKLELIDNLQWFYFTYVIRMFKTWICTYMLRLL